MENISLTFGIRLTKREKEIYALTLEGLSSKLIAARLFISEHTVANHIKNILKKKGARKHQRLRALV